MARTKLPLRYWEDSRYKRLEAKLYREIKTECRRVEPRADYQGACWNYLYKKRKPKLLRAYKRTAGIL